MLLDNKDTYKVLIHKDLWALSKSNPELFKEKVREMLRRCYPQYEPIEARNGFIYCRHKGK